MHNVCIFHITYTDIFAKNGGCKFLCMSSDTLCSYEIFCLQDRTRPGCLDETPHTANN